MCSYPIHESPIGGSNPLETQSRGLSYNPIAGRNLALYDPSDMRLTRPWLCIALLANAVFTPFPTMADDEHNPPAATSETAKRSFQIPAAEAEEALTAFSNVVPEPLVYLLDQVKGIQLNAVRGTYTPREAIHRLVEGTELKVVEDSSSGAWVIKPKNGNARVGDDEPTNQTTQPESPKLMKKDRKSLTGALTGLLSLFLATSPVSAQEENEEIQELSPFTVKEESVLGYVSRESLSGSKTAEQLIDLPSMVNVVTTDFIEDTVNYDRVIDVLRNSTPGIKSIGPRQPNYYIRGFRSRDHGIDGLAQRGLNRIPMSFIQSVEVLKGPSALMYGAFADVGGYVNRNLKRPFETRQTKVGGVVGTDNYLFGYIDTTGPIPGMENIQYRFNAEYLDRDFPYNDFDYRKSRAYRLALNFDLSKYSKLMLAAMRFETDQMIQRAPLNPDTGDFVDFSVSEGASDVAESQNQDWLFQLDFTNTPSEFFSFNIKYHYEANFQKAVFVRARDPWNRGFGDEAEALGFTEAQDGDYIFHRQANMNIPHGLTPTSDVSDADNPNRSTHQFESKFVWNYLPEKLPFESKFLFGFGYIVEQRDQDRYDTRGQARRVTFDPALLEDTLENGGGFFDIRDFQGAPITFNPWFRQDANQDKGWVFANERLSMLQDRLHLIYGLRWDYVEQERYRWPAGTDTQPFDLDIPVDELEDPQYAAPPRNFSNVSERYGIVGKPIEGLALFYGFSEAFQDQGPQALTGGGIAPPLISEGTDYGIKFDMLKGFTGTISIFNIDVQNRLQGDPDNPGFKILNPNIVKSDGIEASLAYQYEGWTVLFNYYDGEAVDTDTGQLEHSQFTRSWNTWVKYRFDSESAFSGLSLGVGIDNQNETIGRNGVPDQPSATFFDAFISYQMNENWRFRLAGNNVSDEFSVGNIINPLRVGYGRPQEFKFSADYTF